MKKILSVAVAAAFGAAAFSASAADVTVYGRADLGLSYHQSQFKVPGEVKVDNKSWSMDSGNWTGSRFGLMGNEELANGMKVGFILENGFKADTGALGTSGKLFDRQSTLSLSGAFGTVYVGRMGALISDAGSVGFYAGSVGAFGSGMGDIGAHYDVTAHVASRWDNAVAYVTPTVGGFTGYAQYAMGNTAENTSSNDRYAAVGATYVNGPMTIAGLVDYLDRQSAGTVKVGSDSVSVGDLASWLGKDKVKDTFTFNVGGSYDFDVAKVFVAAQYFKDAGNPGGAMGAIYDGIGDALPAGYSDDIDILRARFNAAGDFDGYGLNLSASAPVLGGTAMISAGYMDADTNISGHQKADLNAYTVLAGYSYSLSKRTSLYAAAGMTRQELKDDLLKYKNTIGQVAAGLVHKF